MAEKQSPSKKRGSKKRKFDRALFHISLRDLMDVGLISAGKGLLSFVYQGKVYKGSLNEDGIVVDDVTNLEYDSLSGWYVAVLRQQNSLRRTGNGWMNVWYKGLYKFSVIKKSYMDSYVTGKRRKSSAGEGEFVKGNVKFSKPKVRRYTKFDVTLQELIQEGAVKTGSKSIYCQYKTMKRKGDLDKDGNITDCKTKNKYTTVSGWARNVIRSILPTRKGVNGWTSVFQGGVSLYKIKEKYCRKTREGDTTQPVSQKKEVCRRLSNLAETALREEEKSPNEKKRSAPKRIWSSSLPAHQGDGVSGGVFSKFFVLFLFDLS
eukprot:g3830.t1